MGSDLVLRRKITFHAHGHKLLLIKKKQESIEHVLMKAFLWAMYIPSHPNLLVEYAIGDKYKPDLISLDQSGHPIFWGEAGKVSVQKIKSLARRFRDTNFVLAKWTTHLSPHEALIRDAISKINRSAPFTLIGFPENSPDLFLDERGNLHVDRQHLAWCTIQ